ncbi:rifamycin-inactivating phosphotransferase [Actinoplanes sp. NPDC049596]|uniref:rifamycin-inactivating phosphotransferase n=1 Tax=unclassified Actinoplanes TaxID=2626549 RepID=UPI003427E814
MSGYVVGLDEIDRTWVALVGGKGAQLGELARIGGVRVPSGFCVTTEAFERVVTASPVISELLDRLGEDDDKVGAELRRAVETVAVPDDLVAAITARIDERGAYAVRSSGTAEDSAGASFAGQHDTYLNVVGTPAVLDHVRRCWASLFTERAVAYRRRGGIGRHEARMAVVVQRMVFPRAAGIMFTADPVTGNRKVTSIDAGFGLGEALVSGLVNADVYQVRDGAVVSARIGDKRLAIEATAGGGTVRHEVDLERRKRPALSDDEAVRLADLGRKIEAHFHRPQDVEWCLDDDGFAIVQSRPITTLFPIPVAPDDQNHVYVSVGHQQMMTEAMKPLGLSVWKLTSPGHMVDAGGRLFVDVTARLASETAGPALMKALGQSDPLLGDALRTVAGRAGFVTAAPDESPHVTNTRQEQLAADPGIVAGLIERRQAALEVLKRDIAGRTGPELLDFVITDIREMRNILFEPANLPAIMAGMEATWWLNDHVREWLGEVNVADTLTLAAPGNVTSEMGLALLDVADAIRPYRQVVDLLQEDDFLERLPEVPGGTDARDAINAYLETYGMRCVGEIDITRPRWSEQPATLVPMILSNVRNAEPGAHARRVDQGRRTAEAKEREVLARLRELPDGEAKAVEAERMIRQLRTFIGYREYPKYHLVSRYFVYKQALMAEARRQVEAGVLTDAEDVFFLTLEEFHALTRQELPAGEELIERRRAEFTSYVPLTAPRVLTSEGEALTGAYRRGDLPPGALAGLAVSAGTVEGRARVAFDMGEAELAPGDILVTPFTDPSWTPAFVTIAGLVTEVGGQMTHGAVIAREYGLPAVVGVENATSLIKDGQRIRVHGTDGFVELI